jgi:Fe2+ transport system protein FeoA
MTLAEQPFEREVRVARFSLSAEVAAHLRAVGMGEGTRVRIVRAAPFGGPLHLRVSSGAELAIDRELARGVVIE